MEGLDSEINIYSNEVKDILSDPPKTIFRWGNTILFVFFALVIFLSYLIKYPDIINAQATLTTLVPPQKEYARVDGKIDSVFVNNYQMVSKGTNLVLLENTAKYKDVIFLKSIIDTIKSDSQKFSFPLDSLPVLFLGDIETEFSLFENSYIQYTLNKKANLYVNNSLNNKYALAQLKIRLESLNNQKKLNEEELRYKRKDLERSKKIFDKGVISTQEYENKKLEFLLAERNFKGMNISIAQLKETIGNTKNIKKQTEIENSRNQINLFKAVVQSMDQLKKSIKDWEANYLFTSNIAGEVSFINFWTKNQTVTTGELVLTIIPKNYSTYVCKIQAPLINSGKLRIGQTVNINLSNFPSNEFGVLKGEVKEISLIPNTEGMYLLDVSLPNGLKTTFNKKIIFKQEMKGTAEIITEDLRLIERIFYQFRQIFNK